MKKLLQIFLLLLPTAAYSQSNEVRLEPKNNKDRTVEIIATKYLPGSFSARITFEELQNTRQSKHFFGVVHSRQESLLKLKPIKEDYGVGYRFTYTCARGVFNAKPKESFVYRLPYSAGKTALAYTLNFINNDFSDREAPEGWRPVQFLLEKGDTTFATRKGMVVEVIYGNKVNQEYEDHVSYMSKNNRIVVEHNDGSMLTYSVLDNGSITVRPGDTVYPCTPIALAGSFGDGRYQVRLMMWTLQPNKKFSGKSDTHFDYRYHDMLFATEEGPRFFEDQGNHTVVVTQEIITKEMSKREIKDWQK